MAAAPMPSAQLTHLAVLWLTSPVGMLGNDQDLAHLYDSALLERADQLVNALDHDAAGCTGGGVSFATVGLGRGRLDTEL